MIRKFDAKEGDKLILPRSGSWPESVHIFDKESIWAIKAALGAQRPLLLRGEPGVGKSQLARAAAKKMDRAFIPYVVHARSESSDLQYSFDAVARLGEAQALKALDECEVEKKLDPLNFLCPSALWWAFDWESAEEQFKKCRHSLHRPEKPDNWSADMGSVILIDEIDKADADLPNGLLETLGNGAFTVPYIDEPIGLKQGMQAPLVVITTNEERELPRAFLRRCMVYHMSLPKEDKELKSMLMTRGRERFGDECSQEVLAEAATQLIADRKDAVRMGLNPYPGQAEYLDLLRALIDISDGKEDQLSTLAKIKNFALKKHPIE